MRPAIRAENLAKKYCINHAQARAVHGDLRETLMHTLSAPMRRLTGSTNGATHETFWALRDVTFEVAYGESLAIIGRNGAGKSTLLKILSQIVAPSHGKLEIVGRIASLLEVGTGFHPELTGRENIFLNGSILGMSRSEVRRKFDRIVDFSGVERFLDTPVKHFSSGMYTRLAFAVAAHVDPEVLIVDEVLAVGDAEFQKRCFAKMDELTGEGRTVLLVTHDANSAAKLCRKGMYLEAGTVKCYGDIQDVLGAYLGAFFDSRRTMPSGARDRADDRRAWLQTAANERVAPPNACSPNGQEKVGRDDNAANGADQVAPAQKKSCEQNSPGSEQARPHEAANNRVVAQPLNPLRSYFESHHEGRGIYKWLHYFDIYHRHLRKFVGRETRVVEIGVYGGGSLQMWRHYFGPKSQIFGVDIHEECKRCEGERIRVFIGDQADRGFWSDFKDRVPAVDVIIDDGGHLPEQQLVTLEEMLPHLRPGGVYICEAVHGVNNDFAEYVHAQAKAINEFVDVRLHPGGVTCRPTSFQAAIHSVHFYPFVIVIEKTESVGPEFKAPKQGTVWPDFG